MKAREERIESIYLWGLSYELFSLPHVVLVICNWGLSDRPVFFSSSADIAFLRPSKCEVCTHLSPGVSRQI